ncbi:MAG: tetratricopeptide repeat protein [Rhodoferax sp.]|nr:tetratricopeptide repeat protein [Rhodoferax sp.]
MTAADGRAMATAYSLREVQGLVGLSRSVISGLMAAGFVAPGRGARGELRFEFADLVLLRTAAALQAARIPPRKIVAALAGLRSSLPPECPLTGLRITATGSDVTVRDRGAAWVAETGQLVLDFEVAQVNGAVALLPSRTEVACDAAGWLAHGSALEAASPQRAEAAYRRAIAADPTAVDAFLSLGAMLCDSGRCAEAIEIYEQALARGHMAPALWFNLALAQEDDGRVTEAIHSYTRCIANDESFRDAHYNLARLKEQIGDIQAALRHLHAYRRLAPALS